MFLSALLLSLAVQQTVTVTASPAPKPERKVCKTLDNTGSRMGGTRVCRTKAEWAAQGSGADARTINDSVNTGGFNSGADGGDRSSLGR